MLLPKYIQICLRLFKYAKLHIYNPCRSYEKDFNQINKLNNQPVGISFNSSKLIYLKFFK